MSVSDCCCVVFVFFVVPTVCVSVKHCLSVDGEVSPLWWRHVHSFECHPKVGESVAFGLAL